MGKACRPTEKDKDSIRKIRRKKRLTRKKKILDNRPTFNYNGRPVRAAGILLVTFDKEGDKHWLFRHVKNKFEDIGGKTDIVDTCIMDTAIRETVEETSGKLFCVDHTPEDCAKELRSRLQCDNVKIQYNPQSKYILYTLHVEPSIMNLPMKRFGTTEQTDWGILEHYYKWRSKRPYHNQLHYRIRGFQL